MTLFSSFSLEVQYQGKDAKIFLLLTIGFGYLLGPPGIKGAKGDPGPLPGDGVSLPSGDPGDAGADGKMGMPGLNGDPGPEGRQGESGATGPPGQGGRSKKNVGFFTRPRLLEGWIMLPLDKSPSGG